MANRFEQRVKFRLRSVDPGLEAMNRHLLDEKPAFCRCKNMMQGRQDKVSRRIQGGSRPIWYIRRGRDEQLAID